MSKPRSGQPRDLAGRAPQAAEAAREQLVPGPDRGRGTVDPDGGGGRRWSGRWQTSRPARASATGADRARLIRPASSTFSSRSAASAGPRRPIGPSAGTSPSGCPPFGEKGHRLGYLVLDVLAGRQLDHGPVRPGGVAVRPCVHDQLVQAHLGRPHGAGPLVVADVGQGAGVDDLARPGADTARAASTSWPSLKMFALTGTASPTTALAG